MKALQRSVHKTIMEVGKPTSIFRNDDMNYNEAREYINSRAKFGIKPGLERIRRLAAMLCDPQDKIMTIHVAGTNGKGSVCVMLSSILSTAGYKTGLYTSPYVTDYLEQFKINGKSMPEDICFRPHIPKSFLLSSFLCVP